jgi:hypothetical protein
MAVISLLPGQLDLHLYRGDDENFQVTMTENGVPKVLPSAGWSAQIRARATADSPPLAEITIDTTDAATGVLRFSLSGADTLALPKKAKWDLQCADAGVRTYLAGDVLTAEQVTQ